MGGEFRLLSNQEPTAVSRLSWRNSAGPVVFVVIVAAILHYVFYRFIWGAAMLIFFGPWPGSVPRPGSGELAVVALIAGAVLAFKGAGKPVDWTYYLPAILVGLWSISLFASHVTRDFNQAAALQQSIADYEAVEAKMKDPTYLINLRPPISSICENMVYRALHKGERTPGILLSSAEVHTILTNLGSYHDIEAGVAESPVTSVDDLQWLALHGDEDIRATVGHNPHTPPETRLRLMDDVDVVSYRIGTVAASQLCDAEVNRAFWNRENRRNLSKVDLAYQELAANSCTPKDILRKLETFPDPVGPKARATVLLLSTKPKATNGQ